jgi:hypothetical protein
MVLYANVIGSALVVTRFVTRHAGDMKEQP